MKKRVLVGDKPMWVYRGSLDNPGCTNRGTTVLPLLYKIIIMHKLKLNQIKNEFAFDKKRSYENESPREQRTCAQKKEINKKERTMLLSLVKRFNLK